MLPILIFAARRWKFIFALGVLGAVLAFAVSRLRGPIFKAQATLISLSPNSDGGIEGLARLGMRQDATLESPAVIMHLLKSKDVLRQVETALATEHAQQVGGADSLRIVDALRDVNHRRLLRSGCSKIACTVEAKLAADIGQNALRISAEAPEPGLAVDILSEVIRALSSRYGELEVRRAIRDQERLDAQLSRYRAQLADAERQFALFLESNRVWNSVPRLAAQADSLQRIVEVRRSSVASMIRSIEEAKLRTIASPQPYFIVEQTATVSDALPVPVLFGAMRAALLGAASGIILLFGAFLLLGRDDIVLLLRICPARLRALCEAWISEIHLLENHVSANV